MSITAKRRQPGQIAAGAALFATLLLTGCAFNGNPGGSTTGGGTTPQVHMSGSVFGGQQPVQGATVQLYTVGTGGNGSTSTPLLTSTVTTGNNGQFSFAGLFSCTAATQVYLVATGGNAGAGTNTALSLMAVVGPCSSINSSTFINVNELTTVAAVYTLAPFMTDYQDIGATGSNPTALVNAFKTAQALVNSTTGAISTPSTGITLPSTELNTLADILAACVNTAGAGSANCVTLFNATGATETIGAGLAIARNPSNATLTALYSLPNSQSPFIPALSSQPNDFTVAIRYTGSELAGPYGIAIDASGNAWTTNVAGSSVVKLPAITNTFATSPYSVGGLLMPRGISIDRSGNVWIANTGGNDVVELSSAGSVLSGAGFSSGSINGPVAIANDSGGNAWVANFYGNSITELNSSGVASGASPITGSSALTEPTSIAFDSSGNVAVANSGTGQLCVFSNVAVLQSCVSDGTLFGPTAVAVAGTGAVSMAGTTTGSTVGGAFTLVNNVGVVNVASPVSGGGLSAPSAVAYDGNGVAWFANTASISAFSGASAISGTSGYGSLSSPSGIAIDGGGNVWTANMGDNSVTVFVGLATPVATPIAANVGP